MVISIVMLVPQRVIQPEEFHPPNIKHPIVWFQVCVNLLLNNAFFGGV